MPSTANGPDRRRQGRWWSKPWVLVASTGVAFTALAACWVSVARIRAKDWRR